MPRISVSCIGALVALAAALAPPAPAAAQGAPAPVTALPTSAVQNRRHVNRHEFGVSLGTLPLDAFTKGLTVSAAYTLHFDELYAWELLHAAYAFPIDTPLAADLDALDVHPTPFERVEWYATSTFMFKPLYFKGAVLNGSLVYGEMYLLAGGGFGKLTRSSRPVAEAGLGVRFYASESVSFRLDLRNLAFFTLTDVQNELWIGLGISL